MAGPTLENKTPWAAEFLTATDAKGAETLVVLVQAAFAIAGPRLLEPMAAKEQPPIPLGGEWNGEPGRSSLRFEPQIAPAKPATDVVLLGHAYPARPGDLEADVGFHVGPVGKTVRAVGDRVWLGFAGEIASKPKPFERIPLVYERAFGGWDRSHANPARHACEARNPVGVGFRSGPWREGMRLPNLEDPRRPIRASTDTPPPAGFGLLCPDWQPRSRYAGTYGEAWMETRMPLLPDDFNPRFYNSAHPDLVAPGHLRGDEEVAVVNASPMGPLRFRLPGLGLPRIRVALHSGSAPELSVRLDTVTVDTDRNRVLLLWRGHVPLKRGLHDVDIILAGAAGREAACR